MFGDFLALAADQIINNTAKFRWMYNDGVRVPLVIRTPMGGRRGYGATHSQSLEKHFLGIPGIVMVAPHSLGDPGDLLRTSVFECEDPVIFVESKTGYGSALVGEESGMTIRSIADPDEPFPTSLVYHPGSENDLDGLLCCYGAMVPLCLEASGLLREQEGLSIGLAVFTQLSPPPTAHIMRLVERYPVSVWSYAEEASPVNGWAAEIIAQVEELRADDPNIPGVRHCRVGARFTPVPSSRELESETLPQVRDIVERIAGCF
jgi:pyruvate/2-oxoglutarate/acetoin dehydrogenase E1 component